MNLNCIAKKPFFDLFYTKPCMAQLLRCALYDATLANADGSIRGPRATVFLQNQLTIAQSKELNDAFKEVKKLVSDGNHITEMLSMADLIQLGGYAAVEYCGGPAMNFKMGRQDVQSEGDAVIHVKETHFGSLQARAIQRLNVPIQTQVALMGGLHSLGFKGSEMRGKHTRWVMNPYVFDNDYFKNILVGGNGYWMSELDQRLLEDPEAREWCEIFAQD